MKYRQFILNDEFMATWKYKLQFALYLEVITDEDKDKFVQIHHCVYSNTNDIVSMSGQVVYFKYDEDRIEFILRWL